VRKWLRRLGVTTLFIEPRSHGQNGYIESFYILKIKKSVNKHKAAINALVAKYML
jgi:transposase InsO family protein